MLSHTVARRYAKGLLDAVAEAAPGSEQTVGNELSTLVETINGHQGLKLLVVNPAVPTPQKTAIIGKISETLGLSATLQRFVDVLAEKQRLDHLSLIDSVYAGLIDQHLGVVTAEITTATPLNPGQVAQLESSLREATGGEVRINRHTDPNLVGGVITRIGDIVYDGSVKGHLERIRERLESS
jgi:F-type H+-transporting ATPase subunit delta